MHRPSRTALIAIVFAVGLATAADANPHASSHVVVAGETLATIAASEGVSVDRLAQLNGIDGATQSVPAGSVLRLDESAVAAAAPPATVPEEARVQLRAMETSSAMPAPDADLRNWEASTTTSSAPLFVASPAKPQDTIHRFARGIISRTSSIALTLTRDAMRFIGTPYVFGGTSPSGFDCSGYVQHVFAMLGVALPRTADAQFYAGRRIEGNMVAGDLVFFQTYLPGPSHVGIYLGDGRFIHSSSHGVRISRIAERYWSSRYIGAKRVMAEVADR